MDKELYKYKIISQTKRNSPCINNLAWISGMPQKLFPYMENMTYYSLEHKLNINFTREDECLEALHYSVSFEDSNLEGDEWDFVRANILDSCFQQEHYSELIEIERDTIYFSLKLEVMEMNKHFELAMDSLGNSAGMTYDVETAKFIENNPQHSMAIIQNIRPYSTHYHDLIIDEKLITRIEKKLNKFEQQTPRNDKAVDGLKHLLNCLRNVGDDVNESRLCRVISQFTSVKSED